MTILTYKPKTTKDLLTSRAGLLTIAQLIEKLDLSKRIDSTFPLPNSNKGINPSIYIQTLLIMQQEGTFYLDDVRYLESILGIRRSRKPPQ